MSLPKLKTNEYTLKLPSTQEEIKFRPFLVSEQKILMSAQGSGNDKEIHAALSELISVCTFGSVNGAINPVFDIEYVFLQLRSKSVGSIVKLKVTCPDDENTQVEVEVDIDKINVQQNVEHSRDVKLTENISVQFRYPRLKDLEGLNVGLSSFEKALAMVVLCVDTVTAGEEVTHRIDMTEKDITAFIDSMNTQQLEKVMKFFETMPKVRHVVDVVNPKTKKKGEVLLEGLESFFG